MQTRFARAEAQSVRPSRAALLQICAAHPARSVRELRRPGLPPVSLLDVSPRRNPARLSFPAIAKTASQPPGAQHQLQPAIRPVVRALDAIVLLHSPNAPVQIGEALRSVAKLGALRRVPLRSQPAFAQLGP